jgi:hypothetical protein
VRWLGVQVRPILRQTRIGVSAPPSGPTTDPQRWGAWRPTFLDGSQRRLESSRPQASATVQNGAVPRPSPSPVGTGLETHRALSRMGLIIGLQGNLLVQPALFFEPGPFPGLPGPAVGPKGPKIGQKPGTGFIIKSSLRSAKLAPLNRRFRVVANAPTPWMGRLCPTTGCLMVLLVPGWGFWGGFLQGIFMGLRSEIVPLRPGRYKRKCISKGRPTELHI